MAALAWQRSRAAGGFYDADVYGMTVRSHRTYAAIFAAFSGCFVIALMLDQPLLGIIAFAVLVLAAIFYATSFLRGASDADE